jgi:hypothetical protein
MMDCMMNLDFTLYTVNKAVTNLTTWKFAPGNPNYNYLCTYDLYGPVRKVLDLGR